MGRMARGYIGAGSNVGDRIGHLREGLRALSGRGILVRRVSSVWETEPLDGAGPGWFLNLVAEIEYEGPPAGLLERLQAIEREAGRVRDGVNRPRELDLDVLWLEAGPVSEPGLTVPHPRMWERGFVLAPLAELDPDLRRPDDGATIHDAARGARGRIRKVGPLDIGPAEGAGGGGRGPSGGGAATSV